MGGIYPIPNDKMDYHMTRIRFGHTWWGKAWLNALKQIDYSNRLPRGMRYARNGSVIDVHIHQNRITASVQGTRRKPYTVTIILPKFTQQEKETLLHLVLSNSFYLSQLVAKKVPPLLLEDLHKNKRN